VETDDDSDYDGVPIIEFVRRYGTDIYKLISADVPTYDNHELDYDASANKIMESITEGDNEKVEETGENNDVYCYRSQRLCEEKKDGARNY